MIKIIKTLLITILVYLIQASFMPLFPINNVCGNIIISALSIIIVAVGRQHGFASSLIFGILMESMILSLPYLHLIAYPVLGVLGILIFADKTDRRLEMERVTRKKFTGNINPILRTFLCTLFLTIVFELINIFYGLLRGVNLSMSQIARVLTSLFYNILITSIIIVPIRKIYGLKSFIPRFRKNKKIEIADIDPSKGIQAIHRFELDDDTPKYIKTENTSTLDKNSNAFVSVDFQNADLDNESVSDNIIENNSNTNMKDLNNEETR